MPNTTTDFGRFPIAWPDLGSEGGTTLHTQITNAIKRLSDNLFARWTDSITLGAGATSANISHNFTVAVGQLNFVIFESGVRVDRDTMLTNYTFNQISTDVITITNNTGGSKTFYAYIFPTVVPAELVETYLEWNDRSTDPSTPAAGHVRLYPKNGKFYFMKSDGSVTPVGSGSGGGINYVKQQTCDSETDTTKANITVATTTTAGEVLIGTNSLKITNSGTSGGYLSFTLDTIDPYYIGKPLNFNIKTRTKAGSGISANDFYVIIYNVTDTAELTETKVFIPLGDYEAKGFFIPVSGKTYTMRVVAANATTGAALSVDAPVVGPQTVAYNNVMVDWQTYIPTGFNYLGTDATNTSEEDYRYRRVGDSIEVEALIIFNGAANANGEFRLHLPPGLSIEGTKLPSATASVNVGSATIATNNKNWFGAVIANATVPTYVRFQTTDGGGGVQTLWSGNTTAGSNLPGGAALANSDRMFVQFIVPIVGWSSNTQTADRAIEEYVYSTATTTTAGASDTTSFAYGPTGAFINAIDSVTANSLTTYRVQFQNAIQATDSIQIEVSDDGLYWMPLSSVGWTISTAQNTANYGITLSKVAGNATQLNIGFGNNGRLPGVTYGANGAAWSGATTRKWRVRKTSGGASVGFPISTSNIILPSIVRATRITGVQSITAGAARTVIFNSKKYDPNSEYDTSTGIFTTKSSGFYDIYSCLEVIIGASVPTSIDIIMLINATVFARSINNYTFIANKTYTFTIFDTLFLNIGDTVKITINATGNDVSLDSNSDANGGETMFTIKKIAQA